MQRRCARRRRHDLYVYIQPLVRPASVLPVYCVCGPGQESGAELWWLIKRAGMFLVGPRRRSRNRKFFLFVAFCIWDLRLRTNQSKCKRKCLKLYQVQYTTASPGHKYLTSATPDVCVKERIYKRETDRGRSLKMPKNSVCVCFECTNWPEYTNPGSRSTSASL